MRYRHLGAGLVLVLALASIRCSASNPSPSASGINGGSGGGDATSASSSGGGSGAAATSLGSGRDASGGSSSGAGGNVDGGSPVTGSSAGGGQSAPAGDGGPIASGSGGADSGAPDRAPPGMGPPNDASIPRTRDGAVNVANLPNVTLWVAGDSTAMAYGAASAQQGWGEHLAEFLISKCTINDQAQGGATVVSFAGSGRWPAILGGLKAGDFVMIEFGINDSSGAGGRFVALPTFTNTLAMMVDAVLAKQATPIMVTPSALQYWVGTMETNAREQPYADAMKAVAIQKKMMVDDLNAVSVAYLNMIGPTAATQIYINGDKAHFTLMGAREMAKLVTQALIMIGSPLGDYVK